MHTEISTYTTQVGGTKLLYSANLWSRVKLTLVTAGPVAAGTREDLVPVLSGKGILLLTGIEKDWVLSLGDRLYIAAEAIHRVQVVIEPYVDGEIRDVLVLGHLAKNGGVK